MTEVDKSSIMIEVVLVYQELTSRHVPRYPTIEVTF